MRYVSGRSGQRTLLATTLALLVFFVAACGGDDDNDVAEPAEVADEVTADCDVDGMEAAMIPHFQDPFTAQYVLGAESAADECNADLRSGGPPVIDPEAHLRQFDDIVGAGAEAVVTVAFPPDLWVRPIDLVVEQGVEVGTVNVPSPDSEQLVHVAATPTEVGRAMGRATVDAIGEDADGTVVTGICVPGVDLLEQNLVGIEEVIAEQAPGVTVTEAVDVGFEPAENFSGWQRLMRQHDDALAVVGICVGDVTSLLRVQREQEADWEIIGGDLRPESLEGIRDGNVAAVIDRQPFLEGYTAMRTVLTQATVGDVPRGWIDIGTETITEANVDEIMAREESADVGYEQFREYFADQIDGIFADLSASIRPMEEYVRDVE